MLRASGASLRALELRRIYFHPDGPILTALAAGTFPRLRHLVLSHWSFSPGPPATLDLPVLQTLALDNTKVQGTPLLPVLGPVGLELQAPALTSLSVRQRNYRDIEFKVTLRGALPSLAAASFAVIWRADQVLYILGSVPDEHVLCVQALDLSCTTWPPASPPCARCVCTSPGGRRPPPPPGA